MKKIVKTLLAVTIPCTMMLAACGTSPQIPAQMGIRSPMSRLNAFSQPIRPIRANLPAAKGQRAVTMFSYIAMDDGLSQFGLLFLDSVEKAVSDRGYFVGFSDLEGPNSSFLTYLINDRKPDSFNSPISPLDPKTTEVSSNDPETLAQTLNWAFSKYPGHLKVMDILAHGGGYFGIGTDDHQVLAPGAKPRNIMSVSEFGYALRKGLKGRQLDVVNMLSCLMANVEALYELQGAANVVIASEDSIFATKDTTGDFTSEFTRVVSLPNISPREIGKRMAIFGQAKNDQSGYSTIAAVDITQLNHLKSAMNVLSNTLLRAMPTHKQQILNAYNRVPELHNSPQTGQRDLWNLMNQLYHNVNNPAVQQAALGVKQQIDRVLIHARDKEGADAHGLSIFMPPADGSIEMPPDFDFVDATGYLNTRFAKETSWDKFIQVLLKK